MLQGYGWEGLPLLVSPLWCNMIQYWHDMKTTEIFQHSPIKLLTLIILERWSTLDWPWSGSWTFWTWSEPDFEPGVRGSGLAEYLNLNLLAGSGSSKGWTWGLNLEPQNLVLEIDEPTRTMTVAVPISLFDDDNDYNPAPSHFALTLTTTRRTWNSSTVGPE